MRTTSLICAAVLLAGSPAVHLQAQTNWTAQDNLQTHSIKGSTYEIIDLGATVYSVGGGWSINESGQVVGSNIGEAGGFLWETGLMTFLPESSSATAINDVGQILGTTYRSPNTRAMVWNEVNGLWEGQLLPTLAGNTFPNDLNNSGLIVGSSFDGTQSSGTVHAVVWQDGQMIDLLDDLTVICEGIRGSWAYGANEAGQVVGDFRTPDLSLGTFLWQSGEAVELGLRSAQDINESTVVVGASHSGVAAAWQDGEITELGTILSRCAAGAINDVGQVVGYSWNEQWVDDRAFIWEDGVLTDLNDLIPQDSGWHLSRALDVNNRGHIVGFGVSPDGLTHGFLLVPEPSTCLLFVLATATIVAYKPRWARRRLQ